MKSKIEMKKKKENNFKPNKTDVGFKKYKSISFYDPENDKFNLILKTNKQKFNSYLIAKNNISNLPSLNKKNLLSESICS